MAERGVNSSHELVLSVGRLIPRVGAVLFISAIGANLLFGTAGKWLPVAVISLVVGVAAYYMLRVLFKLHVIIGNVYMNESRVKRYLRFVLVFASIFSLMLLIGVLIWPKSYMLNIFGIAIPAGMAMSAMRIWENISMFSVKA